MFVCFFGGSRHESLLHDSPFKVGIVLSFPNGVGQTEEIRPKNYGVAKHGGHSKASFPGRGKLKNSRNTQEASESVRGWTGETEEFHPG